MRVGGADRALTLEIDEVRSEEPALDGRYVIRTDLPGTELDKQAVHDHYKYLMPVQSAYRTGKIGHLEQFPFPMCNEERIRGPEWVVMPAYLIRCKLECVWAGQNLSVE